MPTGSTRSKKSKITVALSNDLVRQIDSCSILQKQAPGTNW
jgi:hypothetical protein